MRGWCGRAIPAELVTACTGWARKTIAQDQTGLGFGFDLTTNGFHQPVGRRSTSMAKADLPDCGAAHIHSLVDKANR